MTPLLDRTLQLSVLELLAEVYPAEVETPLLRADRSPNRLADRALRFNLMALQAHELIELRKVDDTDVRNASQWVRITPRGLAVLEGDWEPATDPLPLNHLFEDSRPADVRSSPTLQPQRGPVTTRSRNAPLAALRGLVLEALDGLVCMAECVGRWRRTSPACRSAIKREPAVTRQHP